MSILFKAGIGVLTAGSIAGVSYAGVSYFGKENIQEVNNTQQRTAISDLIKQEYKFKLLDTSESSDNKDNSYWTTNWQSYKNDNNGKNEDNLGIKGWNKTTLEDSTTALKKRCEELATEKVPNKTVDLYQNVTKYCVRSITVEDEARDKTLTILNTDSSGSNAAIWKARREAAATTLKNSLDLLEITGDKVTEEGIRTGCATAKSKNKKETAGKYQEIYDAYVKVCTKQSGDPEE